MDMRLPYNLDATDTLPDPEQIDQSLEQCWTLLEMFASNIRAAIGVRLNKSAGVMRDLQFVIDESIKDALLAVHSQQDDMQRLINEQLIHGYGRIEGMAAVAGIDLSQDGGSMVGWQGVPETGAIYTPSHWLGLLYDPAGNGSDWFACADALGKRTCMTRDTALSQIARGDVVTPLYGPVDSAVACSAALRYLPY